MKFLFDLIASYIATCNSLNKSVNNLEIDATAKAYVSANEKQIIK